MANIVLRLYSFTLYIFRDYIQTDLWKSLKDSLKMYLEIFIYKIIGPTFNIVLSSDFLFRLPSDFILLALLFDM